MNKLIKKPFEEYINEIDWEFSEVDTQYLTHNIHRYSGKFIPQIAREVINLITNEGDTILDPYMGSGTTLLEASYLRRFSIGVDLNPLAILISKVKNTPISETEIDFLLIRYEDFCNKLDAYVEDNLFNINLDFNEFMEEEVLNSFIVNDEWFNKWFEKKTLLKLAALYIDIKKINDEALMNLALVSFSEILRKCSNAHPSYPNVMYDKDWKNKKKTEPITSFLQTLLEVSNSIKSLDIGLLSKYKPEIRLENNNELTLKDESIDAIITHPPYIAAVPYAEYGSLSLKWLGYEPKELDNKLTGGKRTSKYVVEKFKDGYENFFKESYRVLKKSKYLFLMVANPTVKGEVIDLNEMSKELAKKAGFKFIASTTREGKNRRANKMKEEYLLFFLKE